MPRRARHASPPATGSPFAHARSGASNMGVAHHRQRAQDSAWSNVDAIRRHPHAPGGEAEDGAVSRPDGAAERARFAELATVIEAIEDGVVLCGADGRVRLMNTSAVRLLGWDAAPREGLLDWLDACFTPQRRPFTLDPEARAVRLWSRADPDRWIELSAYRIGQPITAAAAVAGDVLVVVRDVSLAVRRDAIRDTFIGMLSHELKTPVTTIYGGAKVLARHAGSIDEDTRRAMFEDIVAEAERLQRLVDDVVAMTRFGDDREALGREPVLLQRVVPAIVAAEHAHWPGVRFDVSIPAGLPPVMGDGGYVEQVVRNLLTNATKYGGPDARVAVTLEDGGDEVILRVLDEGPGIEPGHEDLLFDLFYRSPRTASIAPGAGIGLFVCARLVRAMGGRIWAQRRPEGGAEFGMALHVMRDE